MAVYKPTYCYPHLSAVDARVVDNPYRGLIARSVSGAPAKFIGCRVDTSNTPISGYSVRLLDEAGNKLFPLGNEYISPITELQIDGMASVNEEGNVNTGINGSILQIPFFQNDRQRLLSSLNAIYYKPRFAAQHMILGQKMASSIGYERNAFENTDNWSFPTGEDYLEFNWDHRTEGTSYNQIVLDGDTVMLGETVLIAMASTAADVQDLPQTDINKSGLWVAAQKYNEEIDAYEMVLRRVSTVGQSDVDNGDLVVITNGDVLHNCVFLYNEISSPTLLKWFEPQSPNNLWCDCNGEVIPNFIPDGRSIRWEISLYQGNYNLTTTPGGQSYITYTNLDEQWMDSVVNAGTVLGSTPERIQIASADPMNLEDSEFDSIELPSGDGVDIILQGKYIGIGVDIDSIWDGSRVYVQTYDATYGHVYPEREQLDSTMISQANTCQFFKHSNNPDNILDGDIVDIGIGYNITLHVNTPGAGESVNVVHIAIDPSVVSSYGILDGNQVLLTAQSVPYQNGVYEYYHDDTGYEIDGVTYHDFLRRAASYKTWAPYIGKIIYCRSGDWNNRNIESLAPAGTYALWNPQSTDSGSSALLFTPELPILLFPKMLRQQGSFNLYCDQDTPSGSTLSINVIDEQNVSAGDLILFRDGLSRRVTAVSSTTTDISLEPSNIPTVTTDDYIYFTAGQQFGKRVFKWGEHTSGSSKIVANYPSWDLHTAAILKNSSRITFVSPYSGMRPGMMLKFTDGHKVTYASGWSVDGLVRSPYYETIGYRTMLETTVSSWMQVLLYNDKLHFIKHSALNCDSLGCAVYANGTVGLASYGMDGSLPWKYEVRTNFATSTESLFTLFEEPYLRLYRDGYAYNGLSVGEFYDFDVLRGNGLSSYDEFYVQPEVTGDSDERFGFRYMVDQTTIATRSVHLRAEYQRFNDLSWQSYRWVLVNADGEIVQDTGDKYDGPIETTFFGLSGDADTPKAYYAVLYVTDTANDVLRYVIKLSVGVDVKSNLVLPFSATFDCQTHSVLLSYHDIFHVLPTYKDGYDYVVYDASNQGDSSPWDGGISYFGDSMNITGKYGELARTVDYSRGSTIGHADGVTPVQSDAIAYGVPYAAVFSQPGVSTSSLGDSNALFVDGESIYFATEVSLGDDYCGEFLSFYFEGYEGSAASDPSPQYDASGAWDGVPSGYVRVSLSVPDVFASGGSALNSERTRIRVRVENGSGAQWSGDIQAADGTYYTWGDYASRNASITASDVRYYLQPTDFLSSEALSDPDSEFLELSTMAMTVYENAFVASHGNMDLVPFVFDTRGGYCCFFDKFLGNLNLLYAGDIADFPGDGTFDAVFNPVTQSANAPSYWVEDRYLLKLAKDRYSRFAFSDGENHLINAFNPSTPSASFDRERIDVASGMQLWPVGITEQCSYWNESPNSNDGLTSLSPYPAKWGHIVPSGDVSVARMSAIDRHPGSLSKLSFRVVAQIFDPKVLYESLGATGAEALQWTWQYDAVDDQYTLTCRPPTLLWQPPACATFSFSVIHEDR